MRSRRRECGGISGAPSIIHKGIIFHTPTEKERKTSGPNKVTGIIKENEEWHISERISRQTGGEKRLES